MANGFHLCTHLHTGKYQICGYCTLTQCAFMRRNSCMLEGAGMLCCGVTVRRAQIVLHMHTVCANTLFYNQQGDETT